jgi:hypothetical protein
MAVIATLLLAGACQSGQKGSPVLIEDLDESSSKSGFGSFQQMIHLYPSPAEMLSVFDMADMNFEDALINPAERADQYLDSKTKTYALGVYITDLAYSALLGRHEETLDYLDVVKSLSEEININEAVNETMIENARNNLDYLDSLYNISNEAFINILNFCERNERSNTIVMLTAGAFTESLYLAVNMIDDYETADQILQHLADQKYTISNFMMFANSLQSDDPGVKSVLEDMERIHSIYEGIEPGSGAVSISTSTEPGEKPMKKLSIGGTGASSQARISEADFEALKAIIIELRNNIVGVN